MIWLAFLGAWLGGWLIGVVCGWLLCISFHSTVKIMPEPMMGEPELRHPPKLAPCECCGSRENCPLCGGEGIVCEG